MKNQEDSHEGESRALQQMKTLFDQGRVIGANKISEWMASSSIEVQGALFHFLVEHPERFELCDERQQHHFFLRYLEYCLRENPRAEHAASRYMAGHSLRAWFQRLWKARKQNREPLEAIRDLLARLGREQNAAINDAIITAVLEHLFENPDVIAFFSGWKDEGSLADVYREAIMLASTSERG